jgi:hypothetical protein
MGIKFITRQSVTEDMESIVVNTSTSTSFKIKSLHALGVPRVQIAELLNIRYQWVRNVLTQPTKNK